MKTDFWTRAKRQPASLKFVAVGGCWPSSLSFSARPCLLCSHLYHFRSSRTFCAQSFSPVQEHWHCMVFPSLPLPLLRPHRREAQTRQPLAGCVTPWSFGRLAKGRNFFPEVTFSCTEDNSVPSPLPASLTGDSPPLTLLCHTTGAGSIHCS